MSHTSDERVSVLRAAADPGYVLLGATQRVYRRMRGSAVEPVPVREDAVVYELLREGLLIVGAWVRVTHGVRAGAQRVTASELVVTRDVPRHVRRPVVATYRGRRYRIEQGWDTSCPGSRLEFWPGRGYVGSYRRWRGHSYGTALWWYATVNPTGAPHDARAGTDELGSHRAALDWLFAHTTDTEEKEGTGHKDETGKDINRHG